MKWSAKFFIQAAMIAAVYAALTLAFAPLSYGVMQVRISEVLTVLPVLTPAAIPGLFVGCVLSNLLSPNGIVDMVLGSLATLLAAGATWALRKKMFLAPLPPVIANGVIVGAMLHFVYYIRVPLPLCIFWVGLGELLSCYVLGYPLLRYLSRHKDIFHL